MLLMVEFIQANIIYFVIVASYFIGSLPTAYLIGKFKNIDIRKEGSGNVGATNTARILGKKWAVIVLLVDVSKGFLSILLARLAINNVNPFGHEVLLAGMASVLGHIFPVWLKFKGGKGVATVCGLIVALSPLQALIAFFVFMTSIFLSKYVSLSSLLGVYSLPASYFLFFKFDNNSILFYFFAALALIITIMHLKNIQRLLSGKETKISSFAK